MEPAKIAAVLLTAAASFVHGSAFGQWVKQNVLPGERPTHVTFANERVGWVTSLTGASPIISRIYKTTDGGATWIFVDTLKGIPTALRTVGPNVLFVGEWNGKMSGAGVKSDLVRTTDGGSAWSIVDSAMNYWSDIQFLSPSLGYGAGGDTSGVVRKTTDGGGTWFTVADMHWGKYEGVWNSFEGISCVDSLVGWAVSYYPGISYRTTDGGVSWKQLDTVGRGYYALEPMRDIKFATRDSGWAVGGIGGDNVIVRTTNGGVTWTYAATHDYWPGASFQQVFVLNSRMVWAVGNGYNKPMLRTTNGGEFWEAQTSSPTAVGFSSIWMLSEKSGWAAAGQDGLYKFEDPVSAPNTRNLPGEFRLEQNFPDPFNPSTTIRFQLPHASRVTLKLYNVLGQEVLTVMDEEKAAGQYDVQFSASDLSSGTYMYRLQAGEFLATRKLILLK